MVKRIRLRERERERDERKESVCVRACVKTQTHTHTPRLRKRVGGEFFYQLIFGGDIAKVLNVLTLELKNENKNKKVGGHLIFNSFSV